MGLSLVCRLGGQGRLSTAPLVKGNVSFLYDRIAYVSCPGLAAGWLRAFHSGGIKFFMKLYDGKSIVKKNLDKDCLSLPFM